MDNKAAEGPTLNVFRVEVLLSPNARLIVDNLRDWRLKARIFVMDRSGKALNVHESI
jgi:hypothetical protein